MAESHAVLSPFSHCLFHLSLFISFLTHDNEYKIALNNRLNEPSGFKSDASVKIVR